MMTPPCDVKGCKNPSVHIVYKILPNYGLQQVWKLRFRLCVAHFNSEMPYHADAQMVRNGDTVLVDIPVERMV